jgi:hypothetical protein
MVDYSAALPQLQQAQAPNMLSMAEHLQKMQTSNMLMQQRAREVQKENALTDILGRSGGKATPDVIKGLIASGNYEPALALQRHAASMGSIGVSTQAAQTALEKSRLELGETKRTLQAGAAARDFISGNDTLTDPDALKKLRQANPDAYEAITKFNGLTAKMTYEASTAKRLDDKAKLDLMQGTASLFAPAFATAQTEDQYLKLYDKLEKVYPEISAIATRQFTPENVRNIVQTGANAHDLEAVTIGGLPGIRNKRTGQIQMSETGAPGANAAMPTQTAAAAMPPAAAGTSPMAPTVANSLALGRPGAAPAAPNVNNLAPVVQPETAAVIAPVPMPAVRPAPQTVEQILAAEQAAKIPQEQALAEARAQAAADVKRGEETKDIAKAKEKVAPTLAGIVTAYKNLAGRGELISAEGDQTLMQRAKIGTLAALPSKVTTVLSPKTGSDITTIENLRRDLIPTIVEMTGAKAADAVAEMNSILNSLTTPGQADASVVATLNNFGKKYGLGELLSLEDLRPAGQNAPGAASESGVPRGRRGAAPTAAPAAAAPASAIPPAAISKLKADPSMAPQFDEIFGAGAAARVMGR